MPWIDPNNELTAVIMAQQPTTDLHAEIGKAIHAAI